MSYWKTYSILHLSSPVQHFAQRRLSLPSSVRSWMLLMHFGVLLFVFLQLIFYRLSYEFAAWLQRSQCIFSLLLFSVPPPPPASYQFVVVCLSTKLSLLLWTEVNSGDRGENISLTFKLSSCLLWIFPPINLFLYPLLFLVIFSTDWL